MSQAASSQGVGALSRRQMLRLCAGTGVLALTGCGAKQPPPTLLAADGMLPSLWTRALPSPWRLERSADAVACDAERFRSADLLALSDGWLGRCQSADLQPLEADPLLRDLDDQASAYRAALAPDFAATLLPVAVSPYVIVWRQHASLQGTPQDWTWLLQPALARRLVLPASPRLAIELAARMGEGNALTNLRRQALTFDDRQGLNWLVKGEALAIVLPLQRAMALLRRDQRFSAVLPASGAPLHWTFLARPASTREPLPQSWVEQSREAPLLQRLVAEGWRPSMRIAAIDDLRASLPKRWRDLLLPPADLWSRCWSLQPLGDADQLRLTQQWSASAP